MSKPAKKKGPSGKKRGGGGGLLSLLLWGVVALLLLAAVDQFFVRIPQRQPLLATARAFYLDLRGRLLNLGAATPAPPAPAADAKPATTPSPAPVGKPAALPAAKKPAAGDKTAGFVYADGEGVLRFADTLEQIPARYRKDAQPLAR